jgi:AcrR family transcriptional regulator
MARPSVEAERREQILQATCEVIGELGMHEMRLADVARRAGVSSGTVHYYFDTKRAVLVAAFEYNYGRSLTRRRALLDADQPPLALLEQLVDSYLPREESTLVAWRVWAELWAEAMRDDEFQAVNERLYEEWRQLVVEIIARAQAEGSVRAGDPAELANMLVAMVDGLAIQVLAHSARMDPARMRDTLRAFVRTLTP